MSMTSLLLWFILGFLIVSMGLWVGARSMLFGQPSADSWHAVVGGLFGFCCVSALIIFIVTDGSEEWRLLTEGKTAPAVVTSFHPCRRGSDRSPVAQFLDPKGSKQTTRERCLEIARLENGHCL